MGRYDDPVQIGDVIHPPGRPPNGIEGKCRDCGTPGTWHSSPSSRRILMEPRPVPAQRVPLGKRWTVTEDGTAAIVNQAPIGHCRITHFDVCPARRKPADGVLLALWEKYRDARVRGE